MKIIFYIFITTQFFFSHASECNQMKSDYSAKIRELDRSCKKHTDCMSKKLKYNSCDSPLPISKNVSANMIKKLEKQLQTVRVNCNYIAAPCPAIINKIICKEGKCSEIDWQK